MEKIKSYLLSISLETGCYRHIQIAAGATLDRLHQAILSAFDFSDDHDYAFYMNNRLWTEEDGYYCPAMAQASGMRTAKGIKLNKLDWKIGHKFKYLFDFGDEWVFQCRVLKALADACPQPLVVRSKGEAPEQYGNPAMDAGEKEYDDDEDMPVFPEMYPPQALQKLYDALSIPQQTVQLVLTYFDAMAHLYAVIPLRKALEIFRDQGVELTDAEFLALTKIIRHEKHHYAILGEEEIYPDDPKATKSQPMERQIVEESLYMVGLDEYDEMVAQQQGKPYYIPPREELLRYADEFYFEPTKQTRAFRDYLRHTKGVCKAKAEEMLEEVVLGIEMGVDGIQEAVDALSRMGVAWENETDFMQFADQYKELHNHTRMSTNRGFTPAELAVQQPVGVRTPQSMSFGPNITQLLQSGKMSIDELRKAVWTADDLPMNLRKSLLQELERVEKGKQPGNGPLR